MAKEQIFSRPKSYAGSRDVVTQISEHVYSQLKECNND